ncbi:MAG: FAD-dependent oxidoreductase [bacterium]|nr:FAD-dependent oxidoreductase [bacterium]
MAQPQQSFDLLIIGGGAAGYSAAMYARRYRLSVGVVEGKQFGGYTALAGVIENYPGVLQANGLELVQNMKRQAVDALGAVVIDGEATAVTGERHCFEVTVEGVVHHAKTLIIATGMEHRTLGLPREEEFRQRGVHFCATCDGPVYAGKRVAVVGGGDAAVKSANQLVDMGAAQVSLIVREDVLGNVEPINRERLEERVASGVVAVLYNSEVVEYLGGPPLSGVRLRVAVLPSLQEGDTLAISAVFIAIGAVPRTALAEQLGVRLTARGEIDVESETMQTNVDGVYAAGDVCDAAWGFKQTITSAAQGAIAATSAYRDVTVHGGSACSMHAIALPPGALPAVLPL